VSHLLQINTNNELGRGVGGRDSTLISLPKTGPCHRMIDQAAGEVNYQLISPKDGGVTDIYNTHVMCHN
jgi:hypothetical protein